MKISKGMVLDLHWRKERKTVVVLSINKHEMLLLYLKDRVILTMSKSHFIKQSFKVIDVSDKMYKGMPMVFWFYALLEIDKVERTIKENSLMFQSYLSKLFNDDEPFCEKIRAGNCSLYSITCADVEHSAYRKPKDGVRFIWYDETNKKESKITFVKKSELVEMYQKYFLTNCNR